MRWNRLIASNSNLRPEAYRPVLQLRAALGSISVGQRAGLIYRACQNNFLHLPPMRYNHVQCLAHHTHGTWKGRGISPISCLRLKVIFCTNMKMLSSFTSLQTCMFCVLKNVHPCPSPYNEREWWPKERLKKVVYTAHALHSKSSEDLRFGWGTQENLGYNLICAIWIGTYYEKTEIRWSNFE